MAARALPKTGRLRQNVASTIEIKAFFISDSSLFNLFGLGLLARHELNPSKPRFTGSPLTLPRVQVLAQSVTYEIECKDRQRDCDSREN